MPKMKILFFQNCISPHQMPYIKALAGCEPVERVTVIAPCATLQERSAMGWGTDETAGDGRLSVSIAPGEETVERLLEEADVALFSGITAFPELQPWLRMAMRHRVRKGCITEAPLTVSVDGGSRRPLWMHRVKFLLKDYRFARRFDWMFAIGPDAVAYYRSWRMGWRVVPFMYCTSMPELSAQAPVEGPMRILYTGSLSLRKDVMTLLRALEHVTADYELTLAGDGTERTVLEAFARKRDVKATFLGNLPMEQCQRLMGENDLLVLPSIHDGWGAVVNEAMLQGAWVLASNGCGARQLLMDSGMGHVFPVGDDVRLGKELQEAACNLELLRQERETRTAWAREHISPQAVAQIMLNSLCEYFNSSPA